MTRRTPATSYIHGTDNAYVNHGCRCAACRKANAERCKAMAERRDPAAAPHGTAGGYVNWGCRCQLCTRVHSADCRARRARRRAVSR